MTRLVSLRASFKEQMEREGLRFSYMPVLIKAISLALSDFPAMNAHVNEDCSAITYKADHNVGIAMDTPEGLVVPNVKQVQVFCCVSKGWVSERGRGKVEEVGTWWSIGLSW